MGINMHKNPNMDFKILKAKGNSVLLSTRK